MDIVVGSTSSVKTDSSQEGPIFRAEKNGKRKDRRKNKRDRRSSVREGVFVSISGKSDRRVFRDRRKAGG